MKDIKDEDIQLGLLVLLCISAFVVGGYVLTLLVAGAIFLLKSMAM